MGSPTAEGVRVVGRRYRLMDKVGEGGMGTVWRAYDELLGRTVAVKEVCLPKVGGLDRAELRARTMREARAAARLSHPNAVTVHDVIEEDGQPWIVMALVPAHSLADVLAATGAMPPRRVAQIGLALLSALEAAHAAGILHRDVKPANVLLGHDGRVVLTDFGVATLEGDPGLTGTGMLLGSPAYMAPERALGHPVGPASDLWSLGATLYAAVEGRPPYDRPTSMATLAALATEDLEPSRAAGPLGAALTGLLQRDPRERLDAAGARHLFRKAATDTDARASTAPAWQPVDQGPTARSGPSGAAPSSEVLDPWAATTVVAEPAPRPARRLHPALLGGLALAVVAIVAAALIVAVDSPQRSTISRGQGKTTPSPAATAKVSPSPTGPTLPAVPAGFSRYHDTAGWSIGRPAGWRPVFRGGDEVQQFSEDFSGLDLYVHSLSLQQDPLVVQLRQQERDLQGQSYRRLFLGAVRYRGYQAADFEYTYDPEGPATHRHVRSRLFTINAVQYELRLDLPVDRWNLRYFTVAADTFQPAA